LLGLPIQARADNVWEIKGFLGEQSISCLHKD
jgi:hypothetical protein